MKIALTVWQGRISPVFDVSGRALLVELEDGRTLSERELELPDGTPLDKLAFLAEAGVEELVCGAMSRPAQLATEGFGIKAHPFVAGELREVFQAWSDGVLSEPRFSMPGCRRGCCRSRQWRFHGENNPGGAPRLGPEQQ